jgi:MarR family transcriptional regulator, transcriptional regulator for hemolysin
VPNPAAAPGFENHLQTTGSIMADSRNNDVAVLVHDVARYMRTYAHQLAQEHGITRAQLLILARLEQEPEISQNELACAAEVTPTTIARLVDRLEQLGFVKRCADPEDRRIWRLQLTPAAMPLLSEVGRFRAKLRSVMTKGLDPQTIDLMVAGLRRMKANLAQRLAAAAE